MTRPTVRPIDRHACAALVAALFAVGACGSDRGVPSTVKGSIEGGVTGPGACYVNANAAAPSDGAAVITIDASQKFQTMQGFGTSARVFDDPHVTETFDQSTKRAAAIPPESQQNQILDALYYDLGLSRVRMLTADLGGVEPVNDNADPQVADLSKFDFSWKQGDAQIDLVKNIAKRGPMTFYSSTWSLEKWMTESNPEEYAEWVMVTLRRWRDKGVEMPYFSLKNEPGYAPSGGLWSGEYLRQVTKILGARIKAEGMKTKLVVPDDVTPSEAYSRLQIILADPDARQYIGAIGYHVYQRGGEDKIKQLGEQYGIPIWMTEYSTPDSWLDWAMLTHELITQDGVSAVDYMWGFFGDWDKSQLIALVVSNGAYQRFRLTPQYYAMGQYSRFVRPGAVRVAATSSDPNVKASAYVDGYKLIIVATYVGSGGTGIAFERRVRFELGSSGPCVRRADAVRTSDSDSWLPLATTTVDVPRFSASLPARSVTTFVGQQ